MNWTSWWRRPADRSRATSAHEHEFDSGLPQSHLADRDPHQIARRLDELLTAHGRLDLHLPGMSGGVGAILERRARGVMTLSTGVPLAIGAGELPSRLTVTAAMPQELLMFSVQSVSCADRTRLLVREPAEMLHLQSREFYRVRCVQGRGLPAALHINGWCDASVPLHLTDVSEGGAGVAAGSPARGVEPTPLSATLWLNGEVLPVARVRVAHQAPSRGGQWRLGLQFEQLAPEVERALRRGVAILGTRAAA
jgi:hypothetical protein